MYRQIASDTCEASCARASIPVISRLLLWGSMGAAAARLPIDPSSFVVWLARAQQTPDPTTHTRSQFLALQYRAHANACAYGVQVHGRLSGVVGPVDDRDPAGRVAEAQIIDVLGPRRGSTLGVRVVVDACRPASSRSGVPGNLL
jgi:hypothetical protein